MLTELRIRNFAIIESVNLPFAAGLNVLSGETGAGKSIIVGALGLLIGDRAASDQVRTGAERATIEGVFEVAAGHAVRKLLDGRGVELDDSTLVLKREVLASGARTRAWINGSPVTASVLAEVGRQLVNVHGQHEAQALLDPEAQRAILDQFGNAVHAAHATAAAWRALADARAEVQSLTARRDEARKRADYLTHVAAEVEEAQLREGEEESLADEAHRLAHGEELGTLSRGVQDALDDGDDSVVRRLGQLQRPLGALQKIDPTAARLQELYDAAYYAMVELAQASAAYRDSIESDPARLDVVERRRDLLAKLSRKHGGTLRGAIEAGRAARAELDLLDTAAGDLRGLESRVKAADESLRAAAGALSALRRAASATLAKSVASRLPELGMPDGRFVVALKANADTGEQGAEDVEFLVTLNVGHDARPLSRVASGGELSRVMLALKVILARLDQVPTLVFDEVDSGIGGAVGLMVGDAMRRVAEHHQVFAITHLAQIAARASHHIVVSKGARAGVTTADIAVVDGESRVEELARMLSGDVQSALGREHARELLASAAAPPAAGARLAGGTRAPQRPKSRR